MALIDSEFPDDTERRAYGIRSLSSANSDDDSLMNKVNSLTETEIDLKVLAEVNKVWMF